MKLKGKVAIITGSGRGLGRAAAIAMARQGAAVVVLSRTPAELEEVTGTIVSSGGRAVFVEADVSKPGDVKRAVERAASDFGGVDILMNNAGIVGPFNPLHEVDGAEWNEVMGINLGGAHLFSRAAVPFMTRRGSGKIINVTSGLGSMVYPGFGAYSVSKAGLIHMTKIMASELSARNIQVNGLDPGAMDTRMQEDIRGLGPEVLGRRIYEDFKGLKDEGLLTPPEEAGSLAVFLASSESDGITGEDGTGEFYERLGYRPS
jgi:NAD(P)-dependent dehydrogenase (short-subunit alcohol dehydrogenase family)